MISLLDAVKAVDLLLGDGLAHDSKKKAEVFHSHGSMIKLINKFIVTPNIIVSNSVKDSKIIKEVVEHNVSLFASLYTQVFTTLVSLHGLKPDVAFELLSSNYETTYGAIPGNEDDTFDQLVIGLEDGFSFLPGLEANSADRKRAAKFKKEKRKASLRNRKDKQLDKDRVNKYKQDKRNETELERKEAERLSVKLSSKMNTPDNNISKLITREIEISISVKDKTIVIPVMIKANVIYTNFSNIENMLGTEDNTSFLDRLDDYRAGAITLNDFVFANDLINDYKKRRIKDRDDLIREMRLRELNAASKYAKHGVSGYGKFYQMLIISNGDSVRIEKKLRGSLHKDRVKSSFLDATSSLALTVIDQDYDRVVMFINDLKGSIDFSFSEISKKSDKSDGMEELLKILMTTRSI